MQFYLAKVKVKTEDDKGKVKTQTWQLLVDAVSVTDVEAIVTKYMTGSVNDWELASVLESKIMDILPGVDGK